MLTNIYVRMELRFWDWAIPMLTNSRRIHWVLKQLHPIADQKAIRKLGIQSLLVSIAGLVSGAAAYGLFNR